LLLRVAAILLCLTLPGCEGVGYITQGFTGGERVKRQYKLPDKPTVVLVDDPDNQLGNPALVGVVAANLGFHLKENKAVKTVVDHKQVVALTSRLGDQYRLTPIDQVGRLVDAQQVIYVLIEQVQLQAAPGMYRPTAVMRVKVIDAQTSARLFPEPPPIVDPVQVDRGRSVIAQMNYRKIDAQTRGTDALAAQHLAEQMGLDAARLFFDWSKPDMGRKFDDAR
jgi:hypothetical protein